MEIIEKITTNELNKMKTKDIGNEQTKRNFVPIKNNIIFRIILAPTPLIISNPIDNKHKLNRKVLWSEVFAVGPEVKSVKPGDEVAVSPNVIRRPLPIEVLQRVGLIAENLTAVDYNQNSNEVYLYGEEDEIIAIIK